MTTASQTTLENTSSMEDGLQQLGREFANELLAQLTSFHQLGGTWTEVDNTVLKETMSPAQNEDFRAALSNMFLAMDVAARVAATVQTEQLLQTLIDSHPSVLVQSNAVV